MNPWSIWASSKVLLDALVQIIAFLTCHDHASYCALHWLCSFSVVGIRPLSVDVVPTMRSMTPMKSYIIFRSARQAKPPLFIPIQSHSSAPASGTEPLSEEQYHPVDPPGKQTPLIFSIQSHSLAPALFYCIRTTVIQLLLVTVLEPIPLHDLSLSQ